MTTAILLFAIAAVGGLVMGAMRFGGRELPPMGLALLHGALAAAGLVTLILALVGHGYTTVSVIALIGLVVAALGGFYLFSFHLKKVALPIPIMIVHAGVAVISFVVLLLGAYMLHP
jgi:hypothetical protein